MSPISLKKTLLIDEMLEGMQINKYIYLSINTTTILKEEKKNLKFKY